MKLFYRKFGSGPPLIILHGLYGSSDNWVTIAKSLSDIYTVYLPDQRNHGQSPHSDAHDYPGMRDDLYELAGDLKLNKFFLAGHSMGGRTAISFALKWPEMLNGLLIADITPFNNELIRTWEQKQHEIILNSMLAIDLKSVKNRSEVESELNNNIASERDKGLILKNLQRTNTNNFVWKVNALALKNNMGKIMGGIERGSDLVIPVTGFPVLFIRGENSQYLPIEHFNDIRRIFPAAEFFTIQGAGHWVHSDNPGEVVKMLKMLVTDR